MPRVERRRVQGRPMIETGSRLQNHRRGDAGRGSCGPNRFGQQLQGRHRGVDESGGEIARGFVSGAGALRLLGMSWVLFGGCMLLHGAAAGRFSLLLRTDTAPAHRQADAKAEDQGCEAGNHVQRQMKIRWEIFNGCEE